MGNGCFRRRSLEKKDSVQHYEMPQRNSGVVVKFSKQKGYGFIRPDDKQLPDIFVHRTSIVSINKVPNLRVGQKTDYDVTVDPRTGKPHAVNVTGPNRSPLDDKASKPNTQTGRTNMNPNIPGGVKWGQPACPQYEKQHHHQRNMWNAVQERIIPKDMSMTVTINNEDYRRNQTYPETNVLNEENSRPYHYHPNSYSSQNQQQQHHPSHIHTGEYNQNQRDYGIQSHHRRDYYIENNDSTYPYQKQEYWRYENESHNGYQNDNSYRYNNGYEYTRQQQQQYGYDNSSNNYNPRHYHQPEI